MRLAIEKSQTKNLRCPSRKMLRNFRNKLANFDHLNTFKRKTSGMLFSTCRLSNGSKAKMIDISIILIIVLKDI